MPTTYKFAAPLTALTLATIALAGCAATAAPQMAGASPEPAEVNAPGASATAETDPNACADPAWIVIGGMRASVSGDLEDRGARDLAAGTVSLDGNGDIVSYTVAPGDAPDAIGERLCIEIAALLPFLNHVRTIQPGQVLWLRPNPDVPWVDYFNPADAPAGFRQIPYQQAIEAMGAAADAGDVDTMRAIWADTLSEMFTNPADIDVIQQALDAGDPDVLRQMFS